MTSQRKRKIIPVRFRIEFASLWLGEPSFYAPWKQKYKNWDVGVYTEVHLTMLVFTHVLTHSKSRRFAQHVDVMSNTRNIVDLLTQISCYLFFDVKRIYDQINIFHLKLQLFLLLVQRTLPIYKHSCKIKFSNIACLNNCSLIALHFVAFGK